MTLGSDTASDHNMVALVAHHGTHVELAVASSHSEVAT